MNTLISKLGLGLLLLFFIGCSSYPTRETSPEKFDLIQSGLVKKTNTLKFKLCFIAGSEVKNRIAYNVKTIEKASTNGYRVDSYGGGVLLLLSADILHSGLTRLYRLQNSSLTDLSQQIKAFDMCLAKYQ